MIEMNKELLFDIMEEYEKYSIPLIKQLKEIGLLVMVTLDGIPIMFTILQMKT